MIFLYYRNNVFFFKKKHYFFISALELKSAYSHSKISVVEQRFKDASLQTKETLSIALPDHPLLFENRFETQELHPEPPFTTAKIRGKLSVKHTIGKKKEID